MNGSADVTSASRASGDVRSEKTTVTATSSTTSHKTVTGTARAASSKSSWLTAPAPIRTLFSQFPLQTLPANDLPSSYLSTTSARPTSRSNEKHTATSSSSLASDDMPELYVFTTSSAAAAGQPSFNPTCLKWQAYLRLHGVKHRTVPSNNHASPSGALPFLLPPRDRLAAREGRDAAATHKPVAASQLREWARRHGGGAASTARKDGTSTALTGLAAAREDAYVSLIEHRLRAAWLHSLYLTTNFTAVARALYVDPASRNALVRASLGVSLQRGAREALHRLCPVSASAPSPPHHSVYNPLNAVRGLAALAGVGGAALELERVQEEERIYGGAAEALAALETLLGGDEWFFGCAQPGDLDVALFAYTWLLGDGAMQGARWIDRRLCDMIDPRGKLAAHRDRMFDLCFGKA